MRFCLAKDIRPVAFSPVARPSPVDKKLQNDAYIQELAAKYNKSAVQIMLNWGLCKGHVVIPKATGLDHQLENLAIFDFKLTEDEILGVEKLNKGIRLCNKFGAMEGFDVFA